MNLLMGVGGEGIDYIKSLSGLLAWYKADIINLSDGSTIATWPDSSGNGFNASGSGTSSPTYETNEKNGLPIVRLDGTNGFQLAANPSTAESEFDISTYTIFAVAKRASGTGATIISKNSLIANNTRRKLQLTIASTNFTLSAGNDGSAVSQTGVTTTDWNIYGVVVRGNSDCDLIVNGVVSNKTTTIDHTTFGDARVEIGQCFSNGAERLTGDIAEIIVFNRPLTSDESLAVGNYLSIKWSIAGVGYGG